MGGLLGGGSTITTSDARIGALQIQQSTYGVVTSVVFGTSRIAGNLLDYIDFTAIPHTTTQTSGGKGGGGVTQSNTTYTYTVALIIGLCEGAVTGVGKIWNDKSIVNLESLGLTLFNGATGQLPWGYMRSKHPERALTYPKVAYLAAQAFNLGSNANLPNLTFELMGRNLFPGTLDSNPKDIITAILSDPQIGVGFPAKYIADLTQFSNYCVANGVLFSPAYSSQDESHVPISTLCQAANSEVVWSQGKLKIVPYDIDTITANNVTYTPEQIEIPNLTIDDFVYEEGQPPVKVKPNLTADRYNIQPIEIMNRANDYNIEPIKATDDSDISDRGTRQADSVEMHFITDPNVGQFVAQSILQRQLYVSKQYEFTLTWRHCLLDPMDVATITELDFLGLNKEPIRIIDIKEDDNFNLQVTAEDCPEGVHSPALYATQLAQRPTLNYNISPGNVNQPIIFEAPDTLTTNGLEVWIGACGGVLWGGTDIWVSEDKDTYKRMGKITAPARQGVLATQLLVGTDPDTANTLAVDMTISKGELLSGTKADADNLNTICYVDGEFISYETATLTGANQYNLSYLRRGAYNSAITVHPVGNQFVRLDDALFKYPFTQSEIGKTIYFKLTSFNIFGSGSESLADVQVYSYTIKGTALTTPLPVVQNLRDYYDSGNLYLIWDPVIDFREPIEYEIRKGDSWSSAEVLGRTFNTKFQAQGNGTYLISAAYKNIYSLNPAEIMITGARYVQNVIAEFDEAATNWGGTLSGGAALKNNTVYLTGAGNFDDIPNVDSVSNIDFYGGASSQGIYTIPVDHRVDIGESSLCSISVNYTAYGDTIAEDFDMVQDVDSLVSWDGDYSQYVNFQPQINIATDDGVFKGWQDFYVGQYNGRIFDFRIILNSYDSNTTAIVSGFSFAVDVPDITESKNVTALSSGVSILYDANFHAVPQPQITIFNAQSGDDVILSAQTKTGFSIQIVNGGVGVTRNINYMVQKY